MTIARLIAFYVPRFYPIPETDAWRGKGFTEWRDVAKARPLFARHRQPHAPANLGFYDLRVPEVRQAQADLAIRHNLHGFCYWHYWFHGTRLFERPFDEVLASGQPAFPFCLAWANERWSRQEQTYSAADDMNHVRWLVRAFSDARYITVNGRPLFFVSRPTDLPDPRRTTDVFRNECVRNGVQEPFFVGCNSHDDRDYRKHGFDGTLDLQPQLGLLPRSTQPGLSIHDYRLARGMMARTRDFPVYPSVFVGWDDTPLRGDGGTVFNSTPDAFEDGLRETVADVAVKPYEERIVVVNAWNAWAEGNHLEPDLRYGLDYLEVVRRVNAAPAEDAIARAAGAGASST